MYADESGLRVCTRTGLAAGIGHDLPVQEIAAAGAEKNADGTLWYCAGLWLEFTDDFVTASTQAGVTAGRRLHEFVDRVELSLPGWPERTVFRASGRSLRARSIKLTKKLAVADPADTTDADATVTDRRRVIYVPFRRYLSGYKANDFCIPAALFERGSLKLDLISAPVTGVTFTATDVVVRANMKRLSPRQPTFWRFLEQSPTSGSAFDIPSTPEAFAAVWAFFTGQRASDQNENQFGPTQTMRLKIGGREILDGRLTIQEANESANADLYDAAAELSASSPVEMPMLTYGSAVKLTQLPGGGAAFPRFEAGGGLEAASGNGTGASAASLRVCTEEILSAPIGSHAQRSHMLAMGATGPVELRLDTESKKPIRSVALTTRLPKKIRSLLAARRSF